MNKLFKVKAILLITAINVAVSANSENINDDFINEINAAQNLWKATENEITKNGPSYIKGLLGAIIPPHFKIFSISQPNSDDTEDIPESFDARQKWPECDSISSIKDQGKCGSCWAVATAACASDRICIQSNFRIKVTLSAQYLMSCCSTCVQRGKGGCDGGYPIAAWLFLESNGLVTGGDFKSETGCQPYAVAPLSLKGLNWWERIKILFRRLYDTYFYKPKCQNTCSNEKYQLPFSQDKHYGRIAYVLPPKNEVQIQIEILRNGPAVATYDVYPDFMHYSSGIYKRITTKEKSGRHAVRLIGWGIENGVKYWLAANSWGRSWGERGTFRIQRGDNECNIENHVTAGQPKLDD